MHASRQVVHARPRPVSELTVDTARLGTLRTLFELTRPWFWPVSMVPVVMGLFIAHQAPGEPAAGPQPGRYVAALIAAGPLLWASVLAVNDAFDVETDRLNERRRHSPHVRGRLGRRQLLGCAASAGGAACLLAAWGGGLIFTLGLAGVLALGWIYSAPPVRLKGRPVWDVGCNALAVGVLGPMGGWCLTRPVWEYPVSLAITGFLTAAALYLPTVVIDVDADRAAGVRTTAVRFGPAVVRILGILCWTAAVLLTVYLTTRGEVLPRRVLPAQLTLSPLLWLAYVVLSHRPTIRRLAVLSAALGVAFVFLWIPA
ncbi:chlorophyll synthase [Actinopolymorpha cephalotaxi]|uniref:4-hydroxybenzoate polyprenyltransferase n=1 Tax=Actinopolymorpha cephalotaxi TaxID=504797 RepID=A0A1I2ZR00_9ACTN|nr:UbiA prenyltransferase family protein [Actinopolymorpha cephalotaxi]NYH84122.1 4-hydroxybenzoate polyprenyltransferase [Actinopolymorpha cephalotaxi]SFH40312.1 chlorophyll synthase [Actinopolymorpha cephalotaxi]